MDNALKCLEIGPSKKRRPGWDTLDAQRGCTIQARWGHAPLPIDENSYDLVFASHVLEHIPWFQTAAAVAEVHRILRPNGAFEVWVPDFEKIVRAYFEGSILNDQWYPLNPEHDPWKSLNGRVFWGARRGEIGKEVHFHRACFDAPSLERILLQAGFREVARIQRPEGEGHGWIDLGMRALK